jgi:hypothetical protein
LARSKSAAMVAGDEQQGLGARIDQDGATQSGTLQFRTTQVRSGQIGPAQIGANHPAILQTRATHVGFG